MTHNISCRLSQLLHFRHAWMQFNEWLFTWKIIRFILKNLCLMHFYRFMRLCFLSLCFKINKSTSIFPLSNIRTRHQRFSLFLIDLYRIIISNYISRSFCRSWRWYINNIRCVIQPINFFLLLIILNNFHFFFTFIFQFNFFKFLLIILNIWLFHRYFLFF